MTDPGYRINRDELWAQDLVGDVTHKCALRAMEGIERQIEAAVDAAWAEGKDFVRSRHLVTQIPDAFEPVSLFEPVKHSISYRAGAVERGTWEDSAEWIVFPCPDDPALRTVRAYAESLKP